VGTLMPALVRHADRAAASPAPAHRHATLVWIDSREAFVARLTAGEVHLERLESDVPVHHRSTGHVRHDPAIRQGGGGGHPQTAGEPHRVEHLRRFIDVVAEKLAPGDDLLVLGPGTVPEQLERHIAQGDAHHGRDRVVVCEAAATLTTRQLSARLRSFAGVEPPRRRCGPGQTATTPERGRPR
jgi:hypothetical protein